MADGGESLVRDGDDHEDGSHVSDRGEGPQEVREERDVRPRGQVEVLPEQRIPFIQDTLNYRDRRQDVLQEMEGK